MFLNPIRPIFENNIGAIFAVAPNTGSNTLLSELGFIGLNEFIILPLSEL
jgi:hypothetical protein